MKTLRLLMVLIVLWAALFLVPRQALADEYDESQSHPLRIFAYLLHPFGVTLEWFGARPLHFLVSTKGLDYVFGHKPHPPLFIDPQSSYDFGTSKRVPMEQTVPLKKVTPQGPTAERVTVTEVPVEKTVLKEVPKIVEVERVVFPDIAFRFDSAQLTALGKGKAYLVAQKLKEKSDLVVVIEGYIDSLGSEEYNMQLGFRRAETVKKELGQFGIDPGRMSLASTGASKPLIDQQPDWARAGNPRVEFTVATVP